MCDFTRFFYKNIPGLSKIIREINLVYPHKDENSNMNSEKILLQCTYSNWGERDGLTFYTKWFYINVLKTFIFQ